MIRAVFFDIDGTLVSLKTKRCPDSTKAAIRALREKGIRVYVASGRSRFELEEQEMLRGMTFDGYLTNNGQIVYDGSWNLLRTVAMVPDEVRALVDYCDERSLPLWLVSEQRSRFNYHFNDRVPVVMAEIHTEIPERCDLHTMLQEPVVKAVMFLTAQEVREGPLSFMPHARSTQWFIHGQDIIPAEGGKLPEALLKMNWPEKYDPEEWTRRINGFFWADTKIGNRLYQKGDLVPAFGNLQADGSTSSLNWLYTGSYTEDEGNKSKRRDPTQTPMQAAIGLYPNWSWCWPVNRRILYNRASVDLNGKPYNPKKAVIEWDGKKWVGDVPDGPWAPQADTKNGKLAYIMTTDGYAQLYGPGRLDGPFPEHYEPAETPVAQHPFSKQLSSPVYKFHTSDMDKLAKAADPKYPIVLTTYSMTEHWCGGGETRNVPNLLEAEPQLYVEMSPELAKEKGIANGDGVIVESARGRVEAIAMVTVRIRPFKVMGKTVHLIGMPFAYGWTTPKCGDSTNRLTIVACDPNTTIPEAKACCVNIRKADKLTEIA